MLENTDQKNSQYAHILRSNEYVRFIYLFIYLFIYFNIISSQKQKNRLPPPFT